MASPRAAGSAGSGSGSGAGEKDDFVTSILADTAPLVSSPAPKRGRGRRGAREALEDQVVSYGSNSEPHTNPGLHAGSRGEGLNTTGGGQLDTSERADADDGNGALAGGGNSFMHAFIKEKEAELAAGFASFDATDDDPENSDDENNDSSSTGGLKNYALFRYALLFINFTFVVASILMVMAGVVARFNSALALCSQCGKLTLASIILGAIQWLMSLFAFNWIRERNILFLLAYVAAVLVITVCLVGIGIAGTAFSFNLNDIARQSDFLEQWESDVNTTDSATGYSKLCSVQRDFNCSGFKYGCCDPLECFNGSSVRPPWASLVCPQCPDVAAPRICTGAVTETARRNLGGFVVITFFSILLATTGISLAAFARKMTK